MATGEDINPEFPTKFFLYSFVFGGSFHAAEQGGRVNARVCAAGLLLLYYLLLHARARAFLLSQLANRVLKYALGEHRNIKFGMPSPPPATYSSHVPAHC